MSKTATDDVGTGGTPTNNTFIIQGELVFGTWHKETSFGAGFFSCILRDGTGFTSEDGVDWMPTTNDGDGTMSDWETFIRPKFIIQGKEVSGVLIGNVIYACILGGTTVTSFDGGKTWTDHSYDEFDCEDDCDDYDQMVW